MRSLQITALRAFVNRRDLNSIIDFELAQIIFNILQNTSEISTKKGAMVRLLECPKIVQLLVAGWQKDGSAEQHLVLFMRDNMLWTGDKYPHNICFEYIFASKCPAWQEMVLKGISTQDYKKVVKILNTAMGEIYGNVPEPFIAACLNMVPANSPLPTEPIACALLQQKQSNEGLFFSSLIAVVERQQRRCTPSSRTKVAPT